MGKTLKFMSALMILLLKMSLRKQERKMLERMFKVSNESKSLRMSVANIITNDVSANNWQSQIKLAYQDFLYDANKGSRDIIATQNFITFLT